MSRPRWSIRKAPGGKWTVRQTGIRNRNRFSSWRLALTFVHAQISRHVIANLLRRAEESAEYEAIEAVLVEGPDLKRKRMKIAQAAWYRGLIAKTAVEVEQDAKDTLILVKLRKAGASDRR
jgi:hypothetical protein